MNDFSSKSNSTSKCSSNRKFQFSWETLNCIFVESSTISSLRSNVAIIPIYSTRLNELRLIQFEGKILELRWSPNSTILRLKERSTNILLGNNNILNIWETCCSNSLFTHSCSPHLISIRCRRKNNDSVLFFCLKEYWGWETNSCWNRFEWVSSIDVNIFRI